MSEEQKKERLTYKSQFGDYGFDCEYTDDRSLVHKLVSKLGQYEDIGTPEEFRVLMIMHKEFMARQDEPKPTALMDIFREINESLDRITIRKDVRDGSN